LSARASDPKPAAADLLTQPELRIRAGFGSEYRDAIGRTWLPDRYFSGGRAVTRADRVVRGTYDIGLYSSLRLDEFSYAIPAKPGTYELHLHFVETFHGQQDPDSSGENERIFDVSLNGKTLLSRFDIVLDAGGPNIADERVFKDVSPAQDGFVHLKFSTMKNTPALCAIELLPSIPGRIQPIRIATGMRPYWDKQQQMWGPDRYYLGGRTQRYWGLVGRTDEPGLYAAERFGSFRYAIPVPEGKYKLTLKFSEHWVGPANPSRKRGVGTRVFDVYFNGTRLLKDFDIMKAAGGEDIINTAGLEAVAVDRTFHGLQPNAQGKLVLSFVPIVDYPCVSAIEVVDEE
jgi:hypothetical protein